MLKRKGLQNQLGFFGILNAVYLILLTIYVSNNLLWQLPLKSLIWGLWATQSELKVWFPLMYLAVWPIRLALLALIVFAIRWIHRNQEKLRSNLTFNSRKDYQSFVKQEGLILLLFLVIYIIIYFVTNDVFDAEIGFRFQVWLARGWLFQLIFQTVFVGWIYWQRVFRFLKDFLLYPSQPYSLAILRILFAIWCIWIYTSKMNTVLSMVSLPHKVPLPGWDFIIDFVPISTEIYTCVAYVGIAFSFLVIIGLKSRLALVINALCITYVITVPNLFGKLWHEHLTIWVGWILALSQCYSVFSLDARMAQKEVTQSPDYTWPIRLIWLQLAVIYFWAGFYKLWDCGFDWTLGQSMVNQIQLEWLQHYDKLPGIRIDQFPVFLKVAGLGVILFELGYVLLILSKKFRWPAAGAALVMHNIFGMFVYIPFYILQVFYVVFIDFNKWVPASWKIKKANPSGSSRALVIGLAIVLVNFVFGMFSIDSYPFSAYPKYAAIVPNEVQYIHFEAFDTKGNLIDVHEIGQQNGFRWESYGWLEYGIIQDYLHGTNVEQRVADYWAIWRAHNPQLQSVNSLTAYVVQRPVSPEGKLKTERVGLISIVLH